MSQDAPPQQQQTFPEASGGSSTTADQQCLRYATNTDLRVVGTLRWSPSLWCFFLDVAAWLALYGAASHFRQDVAYSSAALFALIDLVVMGIVCAAMFTIGGYDRRVDKMTLAYASEHVLTVAAAALIASFFVYSVAAFDQSIRPSRSALLLSFVGFLPLSLFYRRMLHQSLIAHTARKIFLVLGRGPTARHFYRAYRQAAENRERLRFVALPGETGGQGEPIDGANTPPVESDLAARLRELKENCSGIIVAAELASLDAALLDRLVRLHFQRVPVYTLEAFYEKHWRRVPLHTIDPIWPLQLGFQLTSDSPYAHLKRLCDIVLAGGALLLLSAGIALLAALVWLDSGWPVLFRQSRVGRDGKLFTTLKFRTMVQRGPEAQGDLYTRANDPRVTRIGRWLRKLRLDELPQLWNVLRGDMSLIGPRAEWDVLARGYEKNIPSYHFRHLVKPGITGWAQVNYPYGASEQDAVEKLKYDLYYIRHYSLKLDAMIVLKTLHVMIFGKGQ
ncbi:MAG: sugar transferase [Verrucomicrobia bacterium]|nr:sugar transferase [Verrucomicrobiota bacterium]